jgi:hypothetical protein
MVVLVVTATVTVGTPALSPDTPSRTAGQGVLDDVAPIASPGNTSNYLALPDGADTRNRFGNATLDFGATVAADSARLQESLDSQIAIEAFRAAPNSSAKTESLRRAANDLENRTAALDRHQKRTIEQFAADRISTEMLFRRIAEIDSRARAIYSSTQRIERIAENTEGYVVPFDLSARFNNIEQRAGLLYTGWRSNVRESLAGTQGSRQYLLSGTNDALVAAGAVNGQYVREAYIDSQYQRGGNDRFDGSLSDALDYVYELYPWAEANQRPPYSDIDTLVGSVYQVEINHQQGRLLTYLDGSTGNVFLEIQQTRLSTLPVAETVTETNESADLSLRTNLTYPTGPMELTVRNTATGTPADARITVDGQFVGETGTDGSLWTVQPDETARIVATDGDDRVVLDVIHDRSGI